MEKTQRAGALGAWHVTVAGVALIVASTTLVSDFVGWLSLGIGFFIALGVAFGANFLLGLSVAELSTRFPRSGALYSFAAEGLSGPRRELIGVFFGLLFYGTMIFAAAGELTGGAHGLSSLLGESVGLRECIAIMVLAALIPNLFGLEGVVWVNALLLVGMLGIRWWIGLAGFAGWTDAGAWSAANLSTDVSLSGALTQGLGLALWTFIGIEFVAPMAEDVGSPRRAMPKGIVATLLIVLGTTVLMGVGTLGVLPADQWGAIAFGDGGCGGDCAQLAVGQALFGSSGELLMAVASMTATYGSVSVGMAATSRILGSLARDGRLGPASAPLSRVNRFSAPAVALLFTAVVMALPALWSAAVLDWIYTAAYVWVLMFAAYHVLVIVIRRRHPGSSDVFRTPSWGPWLGLALVALSLYLAFADLGHARYGGRALVLIAAVAFVTFLLSRGRRRRVEQLENGGPRRTAPGEAASPR